MVQRVGLFSPELYYSQLQRLRTKAASRRHTRELESGAVSLSMVWARGDDLCKRLAEDVESQSHQWSPLSRAEVYSDGKRRVIFRPNLIDALVLGAMAQRLTELLEGVLTEDVYAYRPGRNPQLAITRLRAHLEEHERLRAQPKERGLFVLQRDLSAYGESIPTHSTSPLWKLVDSLLTRLEDPQERKVLRSLLTGACRPEVRYPNGRLALMEHGLPTGSPIQQPLANLYLTPLDEAVRALSPELYARFGDDVLVVDARAQVAEDAAATLQHAVNQLGLQLNVNKERNHYFTGPGRPLAQPTAVVFRPASHLEYLGVRVSFGGRLGLKRKRLRGLLTRSRWRVENTLGMNPADPVAAVATALQAALHENTSVSDPLREALCTWVDDRQQLRQLDRHLTLLCAEAISGVRGVRALRHVRPQTLRAAGLPSLLEIRRRARGER